MFLNRVNRVLVTNVTAANTGTSIPTSILGDILVLNRNNVNLTGTPTISSAAGNDVIRIFQGLGPGTGILSHDIDLKQTSSVKISSYAAPTEKSMTIGYNGTSGSLSAPINNTEYTFIIAIKDDIRPAADQKQTRGVYNFVSDASATKGEILAGLSGKVNADKGLNSYLKSEALTSDAGAAIAGATSLSFTTGSNLVVVNGAATSNVNVGDWIRAATGTSTGAYRVVSVSPTQIKIHTAFQGATATVLAGNATVSTSAAVDTSNTGILISGKSIGYNGIDLYQKINFDVFMSNDSSTVLTSAETKTVISNSYYGAGFWQQVRDMEFMAQGYLGVKNRVLWPESQAVPGTRATVGTNYNLVVIEHFDKHNGDLQNVNFAPFTTVLAFANGANTKQVAVLATLESLFESAGVFVQ